MAAILAKNTRDKAIDVVDQDNLPDLKVGKKFDLIGIINGDYKMYIRSKLNCAVFRVPLITVDGVQIITEIWCESKHQEPRFSAEWRHLQLCLIRGAYFKEKSNAFGIDIYVFKISSYCRFHRFIWLSADDRNFWSSPIDQLEDPVEDRGLHSLYVQRHDGSNQRGIIRKSEGSRFGAKVPENDKTIHSHQQFGELFFNDYKNFVIKYRRRLTKEFLEMCMIDGKFNFDDSKREPMFHR